MNPPKPIALKKIEGTYRKDRDAARERAESLLASRQIAFPEGSVIACPKTIRTRYARAYWKRLTGMLVSLGVLCPADLPQVEALCFTLEKLREAAAALQDAEPLSDEYERLLSAYLKLSKRFDELSSKYYVSPAARNRLALDALTAAKTAQEVRAGEDAIGSLLSGRQ